MFGGALHVRYQNICEPRNDTSSCAERASLVPILMPLSLLALLLNGFSLYFFVRQEQRSVMRICLILLSISEIAIHFCMNIDYINVASGVCNYTQEPNRMPQVLLSGIAFVNIDVFLSLRNWCQALITVSRAEVVVRPMKTKRLFSKETIFVTYILLMFIAFALAITRTINERLVICQYPQNQVHLENFLGMEVMDKFDSYCFFNFQATVPVLIVFTMSNVIVTRISPWSSTTISASDARRRNQMKATRTVLFLAGIFTIFQMPTVVFSLLQRLSLLDQYGSMDWAQLAADIMLSLDSLLNILVYISGMPELRKFLQLQWRQRLLSNVQSPLSTGGNSHKHFFSTPNDTSMSISQCNGNGNGKMARVTVQRPAVSQGKLQQINTTTYCQFVSSV